MQLFAVNQLKVKLTDLCLQHLGISYAPRPAVTDWILSLYIDSGNDENKVRFDADPYNVIASRINYLLPQRFYPGVRNHAPELKVREYWFKHRNAVRKMYRLVAPEHWNEALQQELKNFSPTSKSELMEHIEKWRLRLVPLCVERVSRITTEFYNYAKCLTISCHVQKRYKVRISPSTYNKLRRLYRGPLHQREHAITECWSKFVGTGMVNHALSIPDLIWERLQETLGVCLEGFSNAVNCHEGRFCSPFPVLEKPFGAVGNFFSTTFREGVVIVNPPYSNEVMTAASKHMLQNLADAQSSDRDLVFFCCYPCWPDAPGLLMLREHSFCRGVKTMKSIPFQTLQKTYKPINAYCIFLANDVVVRQKPSLVKHFERLIKEWQELTV